MKIINRLLHNKAFLMAFTLSFVASFPAKDYAIYFFHIDKLFIVYDINIYLQWVVKFIFWLIASFILGWVTQTTKYIKDTAKAKKIKIFRDLLESKFFYIYLVIFAVCIYFITDCFVTYCISITPRFME